MRIQQLIVQVNSTFSLFLAFLVCVSAVRSFQSTEVAEGLLLAKLFDPVTEEVDETVAELLWNNCKLDLKEVDEDLNFCFLEETSGRTSNLNPKGWSLSKQNMQQLFRAPHPQLRQTLLDCIRKNDLVYAVYGEEPGSSMQYIQHLNSFLKSSVPARTLRESSANPPTSAPSPQLTPHSSPSGVKTTSRKLHQAADESESDAEEDAEDSKILIAVVATAISTSILAALLFFCCLRVFGTGGDGLNDDKPLLSLSSLSDSASSSYKSFSLGSSFKDDKFGSLSLSSNSNHHRKNSSIDGNMLSGDAIIASMEGNAGATKFSSEFGDTSMAGNGVLPPPPGRNTGLPPLNPPPGRAVPLPPEPPAPRRLPSKVAPPPPAPPPLPPSKASANAAPAPPPPGPPPPPPPALRGAPGAPPPPPGSRPPGPPPPGPPPPRGGPGPPRGPPPLGSKVPRAPGMRGPDGDDSKAKLKPFFWDKVLANPDQTMVWHQIKAGSFQFNEEMIENLFGYQAPDKSRTDRKKDASHEPASQFIQILEPKKAQNLSILLRALNVTTEEVSDALLEGNELPAELIQTLLKMAPTSDEELKLRLFSGELSQLGPAERFLKALVDIPFPFHRMEALLFMGTLEEEIANAMESFKALEVASKEVRNSRLFLKLLEAVLKTGNRMNDGTFRGGAQAFKLDTLLKLSDVKGVDGKTTLLHFVVQEIVRSEGVRAARARRESRSFSNVSVMTEDLLAEISPDTEDHYRALGLQVVSRLSSELENVKKAAAIDADNLTGTVAKLGHAQLKTREFLNKEMKDLDEDSGFHEVLKSFVQSSEGEVISLLEEEKRITALVKSTGDYFHGNSGRDEGLRLFTIVRDFLVILDKVCKEVGEAQKKSTTKALKKEASTASSNSNTTNTTTQSRPPPPTDPRTKLMPAIAERRMQNSSSSSDSSDDDSD